MKLALLHGIDKEDENKLRKAGISVETLERLLGELDREYSDALSRFYEKFSEHIILSSNLSSNLEIEPGELREIQEKYSKVYKLLENLNDEDYKDFWLRRISRVLDNLTKGKKEFVELIKRKDNSNPIMELYYQEFLDVLSFKYANLRSVTLSHAKAKDNPGLTREVNSIIYFLMEFLAPLMLYINDKPMNYKTLADFVAILIEFNSRVSPPLFNEYTNDYLSALFGVK